MQQALGPRGARCRPGAAAGLGPQRAAPAAGERRLEKDGLHGECQCQQQHHKRAEHPNQRHLRRQHHPAAGQRWASKKLAMVEEVNALDLGRRLQNACCCCSVYNFVTLFLFLFAGEKRDMIPLNDMGPGQYIISPPQDNLI